MNLIDYSIRQLAVYCQNDSSDLKIHAKNMHYVLHRIRSLGRETCEHCLTRITNRACVEEIEYGYLQYFCNMDCYFHKKHVRKMYRSRDLIRIRGIETCYNHECGNIIHNLKTCIQDTDFGCGPRDEYTVYYCSRNCYNPFLTDNL